MVSGIQWEHSSRSLVRHADIVVRNISMAYVNDNGLGPVPDDALLATAADILESGAGPSRSQKADEPQETNYYGSPTRGSLPIVARPEQGAGTSDGHSTSRAGRQSDIARIGSANTTNSSLRRTGRYTQITTSIGGSMTYWHKQWDPNSTSSQK